MFNIYLGSRKENRCGCFSVSGRIATFTIKMTKSSEVSYKTIWRIAYPILISVLMEQLINLTDTAFLGHVGEVALGASALGGIFYVAVFIVGLGFSQGAQILMARRNGEGQYAQIGPIFYHGLFFLFALAVVLLFFIVVPGPLILHAIIATPAIADATDVYLRWRIFGMFSAYIAIMFRSFYVATTNTRTLTLNSVVMVTTNIVLDYLLIFGHLGLPRMGVAGAALASAIAETVSMVFFIIYTRLRTDYRKYRLHRLPSFRLSHLRHLLSISVWTMLQDFISLATWFIFFLAVEHLGQRELAVMNIIRNISSVTYMSVSALSATAMTLVSNLMGEGRNTAVRPMLLRTCTLGYGVLLPICLLFALFPDFILGIFTDSPSLLAEGRVPLFVMLAGYVVTVPAQIIFRAVSGTGATHIALLIESVTLVAYVGYIAVVIFHLRASLPVSWGAEYVYQVLVLVMSVLFFACYPWQKRKI